MRYQGVTLLLIMEKSVDVLQTFLKEVLKEICNYNMKAPHKNMWELKEEYRHYKQNVTSTSN